MSVTASTEILQQRILDRINRLTPSDPRLREVAFRIGLAIEADAKDNIRNHRMVDRGALINSIKTVIEKSNSGVDITVGSFGVPYAAMNEFGGKVGRKQIQAMFASMSKRGILGKRPSKNVLTISKGAQQGVWKARPYLAPAFRDNAKNAIMMIRDLFRGN